VREANSNSYSFSNPVNHAYTDCNRNTNADSHSNTAIWHPNTAASETYTDSTVSPDTFATSNSAAVREVVIAD
jgi:hypothetical protein